MVKRLDQFVVFSVLSEGYDQKQVGGHSSYSHNEYDKLYKEQEGLKQQLKRAQVEQRRFQKDREE